MRKLAILSLAVFIAVSISLTAFAFAQQKTKRIVIEDRKIHKIEEKGAFLGIYMEDLDKEMIKEFDYPKSTGVLITGIVGDSPAEEAGLEKDDVIYSIAGDKVKDTKGLSKLIGSKEPGDKVKVVVYRDGKKKTFNLALGEKKTAYVTINMDDYDDMADRVHYSTLGKGGNVWVTSGGDHFSVYGGRGRMGVQLHELDDDLAPYFKVKEGEGVLVLKVIEDSPAEEAGLKAGDVIVKIDDEEIEEIDDIFEAINEIHVEVEDDGEESDVEVTVDMMVTVTVLRNGKTKVFDVELEEEFAMHREFIIKGPHMEEMKHLKMMNEPMIKAYKIHGMEQEKVEAKLKALEKEMRKLQKKLEEIDKND
ncbi:MAG: PDZ domain-containing protein [Candidatus Krumholzibacteria bacterium]|nr:PDZ domain-containing protein [Candidatus Krumholzibacteria bacterium]